MECGVWVTVQQGRVVRIEGDQSAPQSMGNCCTKSQSSIQAAYHPDRLYHPLKRTNPKGEDSGWVRITWDEAMETSARMLRECTEKYGGETFFSMCGTSRIYCMNTYGNGLGKIFGSPNAMVSFQVCKGPRHFGTEMVSETAHSWMATADRPSVFVQWAGASEISNYDDSCRTTVDAATKADVHMCVDPRKTNLGKEADYWLPLRPGTDAALALSWSNVIIENDLYDDLYVRRWTNGPFLVCPDIEPSGYITARRATFELKTTLLKESDIVEGGKTTRFMVWDELAGTDEDHPLHTNDPTGHLTWWDADLNDAHWEGEDWSPQTEGKEAQQKNLLPGVKQGWVPDPSAFNPEISPALYGEFEIVLKDGRTSVVTPVWQLYAQRCAEYSPEAASEITGLPADLIEETAKVYATRINPESGYGNGGIQYMLATEHYGNAIQNVRALDNLVGITGNFDTPGGNRGATRGPVNPQAFSVPYGAPPISPSQMDKIIGGEKFPLLKWWASWADCASVWDAVETGEPYKVSCGICQSGDHMNMANSLHAWEQLKKLDFFCVLDLWHAPTSEMADILLPVAHWTETECCRLSQGSSGGVGAMVKCVDPPSDVRYDAEIIIDFYRRFGVPFTADPDDPWPEDLDVVRNLDIDGSGMDWKTYKEEFEKNGWWDAKEMLPVDWGTYRRYEIGRLRVYPYGWSEAPRYAYGAAYQVIPGFDTPTLKHEIWSTVMETYMPNQGWELPTFTEPPESPVANPELRKKYPFTVITGRRIPVYFHSEHRQLPWCREQWPAPRMEINPEDAAELGLEQGDWAWIENDRGKIRQTVDLYYGIPRGVVNCEHQWWYPELPQASHGFELSGVNCLVDRHAQCPHCGASNLRGYAARIYKAEEGAPCGEDGTPIIADASDPRLKEWLPVYEGR